MVEEVIWRACLRVSISFRMLLMRSSSEVRALCAAASAGSVARLYGLVEKLACLRMGVDFAEVMPEFSRALGSAVSGGVAFMVCASVLGWYGMFEALLFCFNGTLSGLAFLKGETKGLVSVFVLSFNLLRLTVNGDDIVALSGGI